MQNLFAHDELCGACSQQTISGRDARTPMLRCQLCPAVYHFPCAGYYDESDGPDPHEPWLCFRCAAGAPGGLSKHWRVPSGKARQHAEHLLFIAAPQDENVAYDLFYRGRVVASHPDSVEVLWTDFEPDESNPERVPRTSHRIWHGAMDDSLWDDKGEHAFAPMSRSQCPDTFAEIAEQHGVPDPTAGVRAALSAPRSKPLAPPPVAERPLLQSHSEASTSETGTTQAAADRWLACVRAYGEQVGDEVLQAMPSMLSMRRDMEVHPYALWLVVQGWGGSGEVQTRKLWARVGGVFRAPPTMTNRSSKMAQLWRQNHFDALVGAAPAAAGVEQPEQEADGSTALNADIVEQWPACLLGGSDLPPREDMPRKLPKRGSARSAPASGAYAEQEEAGEDASERDTFPSEERSPSPSPRDADGPLIVHGGPHLRKLGLAHLPPKVPPGSGLRNGAIAATYARGVRQGDYMVRLEALSIHTCLVPRSAAQRLVKDAQAGTKRRVHFVITEQNYLGGWWDAKLDAVRQGSLLEGGMRFKVREHYAGDPDNPHPATWVPLVYYGPQAYPYQTPQVMIRPAAPWADRRAGGWEVGQCIEMIDDVADEDTMRWRGVVHRIDAESGQITMRQMVNPYGNAGAQLSARAVEDSCLTHAEAHFAHADTDDLQDMAREPDCNPEGCEAAGIASTDDMEMKVLVPTAVTLGGGRHAVAVEAHATFKTVPAEERTTSRASALAVQRAALAGAAIEQAYRQPAATRRALQERAAREGVAPRAQAGAAPGGGWGGQAAVGRREVAAPQLRHVCYAVPAGGTFGVSCAYRLVAPMDVAQQAVQLRNGAVST